MPATPGVKRLRAESRANQIDIRALGERYCTNQDSDSVFHDIYDYLYARCNKNRVNQLVAVYTGNSGLCSTKWLEETVAFKCYDCESDSTCAVCVDCFFKSNHEGHQYRLTLTAGGCCDCGDNGSWDPKGACYRHNAPITLEEERALLRIFNDEFLKRLRETLTQITAAISAFLANLDPMDEPFVFVLIIFLVELMKVAPAYRFVFFEIIDERALALWVCKHQQLSNDLRRAFNSLYLTMVTSMAFRQMLARVYVDLYADIVQPFKEDPEEWHFTHLSVQLFTYSQIADKAVANGFLDVCVQPLMDRNIADGQLGTIQFPRFERKLFGLYLRILGDFTYLMNHEVVVKQVIREPSQQRTLFKLLHRMHMMNTIQRETFEHVSFENSGYIIAFTGEHTLHTSLRPLAEVCKTNLKDAAPFYRAMNEYMLEHLCTWRFNSLKLCRSFHIPFVRFFASVINVNHLRKICAERLNVEQLRKDPIVSAFDDQVLMFVLKQASEVIRFAMEIKHNLWVYNGESMHEQREHYRQVFLVQLDVAAIQLAIIIIGLRKRAGLTDLEPVTLLYEDTFCSHISCRDGDNVSAQQLPGDAQFKTTLFMHLIGLALHDVRNLEMLSVPRKNKDAEYTRRGYPLVVMDIVSALAMGKLEFSEVTAQLDSYWRHHPQVVQAVEHVANMNHSTVVDKTYVRPKRETYRLIDVMWNPHNFISDISLPKEIINRGGISMLGVPRSANFMQPEYIQVQDAVLAGINGAKCFQVAYQLMETLAKIATPLVTPSSSLATEGSQEYVTATSQLLTQQHSQSPTIDSSRFYDASSEHDFYLDALSERTHYFDLNFDCTSGIDNKWYEPILSALKTINLLSETSEFIEKHNAARLVDALEAIYARVTEHAVLKIAMDYTIKKIRETHQVNPTRGEVEFGEESTQKVKKLQSRFMSRLLEQQKKIKIDDLDNAIVTRNDVEEQTCILCKQPMDGNNRMSFMCLIATNSIMRKCCNTIGDVKCNVYAKAALPRRSSVISTCGHVAHTRCINGHRQKQCETHILSMYGIQRATEEFFCPICKALCNYTLEYIPDGHTLERCKMLNEDKLQNLCKINWRYPFCVNWIPSPRYAKCNVNPHVMYTFNVLLPMNDIKTVAGQGRGFCEDIGITEVNNCEFNCTKCMETDLTAEYNPQCNALFHTKENRSTYLDREHFVTQLTEWLKRRPEKTKHISRILKHDATHKFKRLMATEYCRAIFGGQRSLYGIQNWRHAEAGTLVDPKFWLLYNHIIETCSCRRNLLTVKPSLLKHLVRNYYSTGMKHCLVDSRGDISQLDNTYFDVPPEDLVIPKQTARQSEEITVLTLLVETLGEQQLRQLAEALHLKLNETQYHSIDEFNMDVNEGKFGMDVTCSWSKDVLHELIIYFVSEAPTLEQSIQHLANCVGMVTMQVLEREVLKDIKQAFHRFVHDAERGQLDGSETTVQAPREHFAALQYRRNFLKTLYRTYFKEYIESAEIPADLESRADWMGFDEHESAFSRYNMPKDYAGGTHHVDDKRSPPSDTAAKGTDGPSLEAVPRARSDKATDFTMPSADIAMGETVGSATRVGEGDSENPTDVDMDDELMSIEECADMARKLQDIHYNTVGTFVQPLPDAPNGDMLHQVNDYLHNQVTRLLRVRELHALVEGGMTQPELETLILALTGDEDTRETQRPEPRDPTAAIFARDNAAANAQAHAPAEHTRCYHGMDVIRRVNEETYKAHCNYAFFEAVRHIAPAERHLLDFVDQTLCDEMREMKTTGDLLEIANEVAQRVYKHVKALGYLPQDFKHDAQAFTNALLKHLNVLLDVAFWLVFSVFDASDDVRTKVSYAHLHADEARFRLLVEVTGVGAFAANMAETCADMVDHDTRYKLMLLRATNHETRAPLVAKYDYVDLGRHLAEDAWDMVRMTASRMCPNCGTQPPNPLICLMCGSVICYKSSCCDRNKGVKVLQMLNTLERNDVAFRASDLTHIYSDEVVAHTSSCGGGQGVYISPYNCFLVFMDEKRHCITHTLYSDKYGNKNLHSKVYGEVTLSQTRLANITNAFCQGKLTHEIINVQKEALR